MAADHAIAAPTTPREGIKARFNATLTDSEISTSISCQEVFPAIASIESTTPHAAEAIIAGTRIHTTSRAPAPS
ncbi:hypothetical protein GCM10029992_29770 [Glycomyces albus]